MRVLALDPGERVGWATGVIDPGDGRPILPSLTVEQHGISFLKDMALAVHRAVVVEDRYDVVVYETWRLRAADARKFAGNDMQSSQFIGMVRLACWLNPRVQLVSQGPNVKKTALKSLAGGHPSSHDIEDRLGRMPSNHDDAHDGDALLHLWHYFWERYV